MSEAVADKAGIARQNSDVSSPRKMLELIAMKADAELESIEFARLMDETDELNHLKDEFVFPQILSTEGYKPYIYLATNKLGLQPKNAKGIVTDVMECWGTNSKGCHFAGPLPASVCDDMVVDQIARVVGAVNTNEVAAMNDVYTNLHLLLVSFYRPTSSRFKILAHAKAGDLNIPKSHIIKHGFEVSESLLTVSLPPGKDHLETKDIINIIESEGETISVILLPGILPENGTLLDIEAITRAGQTKGCGVGFVLNEAVGNVELQLHQWQVDFACWETGKFLCAGPSPMGCAFLHSKHEQNEFPKWSGWWGHRFSTRFDMTCIMDRNPGINGYKLSNQSPIKVGQVKAGLDIFDKTSMKAVRDKSILLTGYLEHVLSQKLVKSTHLRGKYKIVTPENPSKRGARLALWVCENTEKVCDVLKKKGIICSCYSTDILNICPSPLCCGFVDIFQFVHHFANIMQEV